jgi:oligopeptide transport system substrate-binding protein
MKRNIGITLGLLVAIGLLLVACQPQVQTVVETVVVTQEVVKEGQTVIETVVTTVEVEKVVTPEPETMAPVLRVVPGTGTYPDIIDPQKSSFLGEIAHLILIYEGLTRLDENLETVPAAAESWAYNDEATQLTFQLRPDLKYSDGSLLNAKRFEYSILRNIDPTTAGEYAQITDEILGSNAWRTSAEDADREALKAAVGVRALDSAGNPCTDYEQADCLTLQIDLERPAPYFHTVMGLWVTFPAKEELITEGGDNWWNGSKYQIGNGPFILKTLEPFVRGYFVPSPNYWGGQPSYDIEYSYITDTAVRFEAYKNNEFDVIEIGEEDYPTIQADPTLSAEANIYPGSCTFAVMFHQLKEPFTDQKVREAFAYALDREAWVQDILKGIGAPTLTWIPPGLPGYQEGETRWGFDPEAAKQAIAESSYGSVENLPEIVYTFADTPRNRTRGEWLAAKWKEVLGVDMALNPVEPTTYTALTKDINTAPQVFILGWCADYADPQNWLSVYWKTGAFAERIGYSNPEFDALVDEADTTVDPTRRAELYAQAQELLVSGAPVAFMWNNANRNLVKPWVTGYNKTPLDAGFPGIYTPGSITVGPMP